VDIASRKRQTYQNEAKPRIYVLFLLDLGDSCKFIRNETIQSLKKYALGCHRFSVNRISPYSSTLQGGSQKHICLISILFSF